MVADEEENTTENAFYTDSEFTEEVNETQRNSSDNGNHQSDPKCRDGNHLRIGLPLDDAGGSRGHKGTS